VAIISNHTEASTIAEIKKETGCSSDICILEKIDLPQVIEAKIKREAFKADAAALDDNYWLNNTEIDTVLSQLRSQYAGFTHAFIHMIDLKGYSPTNINSFDYKVLPVSETDFAEELHRGINGRPPSKEGLSSHNNVPIQSYGVVCNTDSSSGSGQHWFAIYISTDCKDPDDTSKPWIRIECFNSAGGGSSDKNFNSFWELTALKIAKKTGLRCTYDVISTIQHQSPDTGNCGSYSLFYIYSRLNGAKPSEFNNPRKPIKDLSMRKFRTVCFKLSTEDSVEDLF
jgi:hypothetical protein